VWIDSQVSAPDPRVVSHVYEAPDGSALNDKAAWAAANPALGVFRSMADMEKLARAATEMPANEPDFRNLNLNQRVETAAPFVSRTVWDSNGAEPGQLKGAKVYGGLDLSSVSDLTALVLVNADTGDVHSTFWLPEAGLREKAKKDRVPYDIWHKQGLLMTTPGSAIQYEHIAEYLRGVFDTADVQALGFDRYNMKFLKPWLIKAGFSEAEMEKFIEFGQGTASMTPALRELEVFLLGQRLRHGKHPILAMCAANAVVVGDSGARKFDKKKARGRIDGMVSLAMAVGVIPTKSERKYQVYSI
jgi:phage terminase large subunit-like protein